jgi:hypothetical protein
VNKRIILLIFGTLIVLCGGLLTALYPFLSLSLGVDRIGPFQRVGTQAIPLEGTDFVLHRESRSSLSVTGQAGEWSLPNGFIGSTADYAFWEHNAQSYLILRYFCNCTLGYYSYMVYELKDDGLYFVGQQTSCSPPKAIGDSLEFAMTGSCEGIGLPSDDPITYPTLDLKVPAQPVQQ